MKLWCCFLKLATEIIRMHSSGLGTGATIVASVKGDTAEVDEISYFRGLGF